MKLRHGGVLAHLIAVIVVAATLARVDGQEIGRGAQPTLQSPSDPISPPLANGLQPILPQNGVVQPFTYSQGTSPTTWKPSSAPTEDALFPIELATALRLVNSQSLDIAIAGEQIRKASTQYDQAKYTWLPTISIGSQYYRHDGQYQNSAGQVNSVSLTSFSTGAGVNAIFTPADAIFQALAARQIVRSRQADLVATTNDTVTLVAQAYFTVQQARGNLFGAQETVREGMKLVDRAKALAKQGLTLPVEELRARAELARRSGALDAAVEQWRTASADLTRILRLDRSARIEPTEPPHLQVTLVGLEQSVDALIPIGLRNRPELASQQALVEAALLRLKAEKIRPLIPSVILSGQGPGNSTVGVFGGGNTAMSNYGARSDFDLQVVWTFENLGLTNLAKIRERKSDQRIAILQLFKVQDQVAAEIAQAYAQAVSAQARWRKSEEGLKDAIDSMDKNFDGMKQTRVVGNFVILLIRPQEAVAALQSLANAYSDYYSAVADYNRAQFILFRALGFPSQIVTGNEARLGPPIAIEPAHSFFHPR